jgi:hypothetical protein
VDGVRSCIETLPAKDSSCVATQDLTPALRLSLGSAVAPSGRARAAPGHDANELDASQSRRARSRSTRRVGRPPLARKVRPRRTLPRSRRNTSRGASRAGSASARPSQPGRSRPTRSRRRAAGARASGFASGCSVDGVRSCIETLPAKDSSCVATQDLTPALFSGAPSCSAGPCARSRALRRRSARRRGDGPC